MRESAAACVAYFSAAWSCDSVVPSSPWVAVSDMQRRRRLNEASVAAYAEHATTDQGQCMVH